MEDTQQGSNINKENKTDMPTTEYVIGRGNISEKAKTNDVSLIADSLQQAIEETSDNVTGVVQSITTALPNL
jgi:hypothetical protein